MRTRFAPLAASCLALLLLTPTLVQLLLQFADGTLSLRALAGWDALAQVLAVNLAGLLLWLALWGRMRWALPMLLLAAWLAPFEAWYIFMYRLPSGSHIYGVLADTDAAETIAWLGVWMPFLLAYAGLSLLLVCWLGWCCWLADWRWQHRSRFWVLAAAAMAGAGSLLLVQAQTARDQESERSLAPVSYLQHSLDDSGVEAFDPFEHAYPWGLPRRWIRFLEHRHALDSHVQAVATFKFNVQWRPGQAPDAAGRDITVLVIGETGRADRWGVFGASRDTTPQLSARQDLLLFRDAVSASSATREAVPLMLTRRPPGAVLKVGNEASVITAFRQAGYRTYWLSTQGAAGRHETPISVLAHEAHEQHFVNAADYRGAGALDGDLLPYLAQILDRPEPRQLIVLHTLGSHLNYAHRYPSEYARFQPAMLATEHPDLWRNERATEMRNAYDNSVLYTDHVLAEVIAQLEARRARASLLFAADHGETLYDGRCARAGHGFASKANYHVPLFVWTSPAWRAARPGVLAALSSRLSQPVSTLSVFATLTDLAGFTIVADNAYPGLGSDAWMPARRPVTHFGDFDRDIAPRACDSPGVTSH